MNTNLKDEATVGNQQTQAGEEFTPLTKQKLFDGVVLSKLTGTPISEIEKDSDGNWYKCTYNDAGQELTYEDSDSYWSKYTYNAAGQILTCEDSDGIFHQYIAHDGIYSLRFEGGRYKAGCRDFSYEEAVQHWTKRSADERESASNRAKLFLKAIAEHQLLLNQSNT